MFNVYRLKIGLGMFNCVAGINRFILGVMWLLALVMSNVACTVTHNVDILHVTNVAVRTHCFSLLTAVFARTV